MERKDSNPEREFRSAQTRSEEWEKEPVSRTYGGYQEEGPFGDEEEEEVEEDEDDDDLDDDDEDDDDEEEDEEEDDF